ncbi:uncharacterized protein LOC134689832 [Mytilus trossulus]|uniref:uncharacterized protein LOC134689832 n=1 Tax=Mytilus trossulus TaxID=6551 RepID=UPI0030079AAB
MDDIFKKKSNDIFSKKVIYVFENKSDNDVLAPTSGGIDVFEARDDIFENPGHQANIFPGDKETEYDEPAVKNKPLQTFQGRLQTYGTGNIPLNYDSINNNKATRGYRTYDYKVQNAVDLSKLFLQTHMANYTAFDETCDSSALLGMIVNIDIFPVNVQSAAKDARSVIRNPWAHCNFTEWNAMIYTLSLQKIEDFIYLLNLNGPDENQFIGDLNKWRTNGTSFFQGTTIGLELVETIRQEIQVLVEYAGVICKSCDTEFSRVRSELTEMSTKLSQNDTRISTLEKSVESQRKTLLEVFSDADIPEIERWKQNSKDFVKTDTVTDILGFLENQHTLLLIGVSGMGKTLAAQNIALHLCHEKGYRIIPCRSVKDIKKRYKDDIRQVFFVDDIYGKYTANINYIENWIRIEEFINHILNKGNTKILATCRTEIFKQENVKTALKSFNVHFDLAVKYSSEDKLKIARKYLKENDKLLKDIVVKDEFSPLMCFLYSQHDNFDVNEFLNSPYKTFSDEWDTLKTFDKEKFCVLLLCVIHNGTINETNFDVFIDFDKQEKRKLKVIFDCCKLGRDISRSAIKEKLDACVDTYFIKVDNEYKVIHDKMFDFLCCYFGKALIAPIIKYADDKLIRERVQLESIQKTHGEFTITISSTDEIMYNTRLRMDLENEKIHWCLNNVQMRYKEYRDKFVNVVKALDDEVKKRIVSIKDDNGITSFLISCLRGYDELVDLFISFGADVNARNGWFTPLTAACRDGHLGTVEILLNKGSVVNQTNIDGETPLYTACICGHYGLVKHLIERHADINKKDKYGRSPFHISSFAGFEKIGRILYEKGANMKTLKEMQSEQADRFRMPGCLETSFQKYELDSSRNWMQCGWTPLYEACMRGDITTVNSLIKSNANVNMKTVNGVTPLFAASQQGNVALIDMLINEGAEINQALCSAVKGDYDEAFEILLDKGGDLNSKGQDGMSLVRLACEHGSSNVFKLLLEQGADVNEKDKDGRYLLFVSMSKGFDDISECLVLKGTPIARSHEDKFQALASRYESTCIMEETTNL